MWVKSSFRFTASAMLLIFSTTGCVGLRWPPPPAYVQANVELDKDGAPHIDYMPCINKSSDLKKSHYLFEGVSVTEYCIPGVNAKTCDSGNLIDVWAVGSDAVLKTTLFPPGRAQESTDIKFDEGIQLPQSLRYGENIPRAHVIVPAAPLRIDTEYTILVAITAFNSREDAWSFTANGYFRLEPDGKGGLKVVQRGEPCK